MKQENYVHIIVFKLHIVLHFIKMYVIINI